MTPFILTVSLYVLFACCIVTLALVRGRIHPPERGFLVAFWGSTALLCADGVAIGVLLVARETPAQIAGTMPSMLWIGAGACFSLALGLALGWRVRLDGERFLIALVRPPVGVKYLRGWMFLPVLFLWIAVTMGSFAAIYGLLSSITLAR